ncbi:MAG: pantetheine-phosphate adenylyltransferase [Gracilibacteraceae bacterium]|nr:pantetheine-phosphate adenylyltransferase [Gracilibacteraceae bacterium]
MTRAVYPGTFDPVTNGHLDILARSMELFDEVIVAVADDNNKKTLFTPKERLALLEEEVGGEPKIKVMTFNGLTVEFARRQGARALIRGLRAMSDYEYELQLAMMNKKFAPEIETVFLMAQVEYSFVSSSAIKWAASLDGRIGDFIPAGVERALRDKYHKT